MTEISIKVWKDTYKGIIDDTYLDSISFEERLNGRKKQFYEAGKHSIVSTLDNKIIGFCDFGVSRKPHYGLGEIYSIYVLTGYQGMGVGKLLLKQAVHHLEQESLVPYIISTLEENHSAQQLYLKMGFYFNDKIMTRVGDRDYPENVYIRGHNLKISPAQSADIPSLVKLSYEKRRFYEKEQPQFWKYAGPLAEEKQAEWFQELLLLDDHISLIAQNNNKITGFVIGKIIPAPEVYSPDGLTLMIDDFCVENDSDWALTGGPLINEIKRVGKEKGATQILIVCGEHDIKKKDFLKNINLTVASEWYVGSIN